VSPLPLAIQKQSILAGISVPVDIPVRAYTIEHNSNKPVR
jgi:hypothetical protein